MSYIGQTPTGLYTTTNAKDTFSGDASATSFTLSQAGTTNNVDVFVENVRQEPTVAYVVDGNTLTFTAPPVSGTDNIYVVNRGPAELSASHPASQALEAYSGTFTTDVSVGGDLLVGTTDVGIGYTDGDVGFAVDGANGYFGVARSPSASTQALAYLNRLNSDGEIIQFRKDGSTVGSIGVLNGDNIYLEGSDGGLQIGTNNIFPQKNKATADNTLDLGATSARWKDLYLSGGVVFGTGGPSPITSNTLDDYEEGTFTLTLLKSGVTFSPTNTTAYYTKVGNLVHFTYYSSGITTSSSSQSGFMTFSGLPFTSGVGTQRYSLFQYLHGTLFAETTAGGYINNNDTVGYFVIENSTSSYLTVNLGSPFYVMITGVYQTD